MVRRVNHRRTAVREGQRAVLDVASVLIPRLGEARHIAGAVSHGANALEHGLEAARHGARKQIRRVRAAVRRQLPPISPRFRTPR